MKRRTDWMNETAHNKHKIQLNSCCVHNAQAIRQTPKHPHCWEERTVLWICRFVSSLSTQSEQRKKNWVCFFQQSKIQLENSIFSPEIYNVFHFVSNLFIMIIHLLLLLSKLFPNIFGFIHFSCHHLDFLFFAFNKFLLRIDTSYSYIYWTCNANHLSLWFKTLFYNFSTFFSEFFFRRLRFPPNYSSIFDVRLMPMQKLLLHFSIHSFLLCLRQCQRDSWEFQFIQFLFLSHWIHNARWLPRSRYRLYLSLAVISGWN